jgi:hypothetical protein
MSRKKRRAKLMAELLVKERKRTQVVRIPEDEADAAAAEFNRLARKQGLKARAIVRRA